MEELIKEQVTLRSLVSEFLNAGKTELQAVRYLKSSMRQYGFDSIDDLDGIVDERYLKCIQTLYGLSIFCKVNDVNLDVSIKPVLINNQYFVKLNDLYDRFLPAYLAFVDTRMNTIGDGSHKFFSIVDDKGIFYASYEFLVSVNFKEISSFKSEKPLKFKQVYTYVMLDKSTGYYKIGRSVDPLNRERTLQSEKPSIVMILKIKENIERQLHKEFIDKHVRGEWFSLNDRDLVKIKMLKEKYETI